MGWSKSINALIHEQFQPYGSEGTFEPQAVGPSILNVWLPHNTAETDGLKQGKARRIRPFRYTRVTILVTSGLSFTSVQTTGVYWLAEAVNPFGI